MSVINHCMQTVKRASFPVTTVSSALRRVDNATVLSTVMIGAMKATSAVCRLIYSFV